MGRLEHENDSDRVGDQRFCVVFVKPNPFGDVVASLAGCSLSISHSRHGRTLVVHSVVPKCS